MIGMARCRLLHSVGISLFKRCHACKPWRQEFWNCDFEQIYLGTISRMSGTCLRHDVCACLEPPGCTHVLQHHTSECMILAQIRGYLCKSRIHTKKIEATMRRDVWQSASTAILVACENECIGSYSGSLGQDINAIFIALHAQYQPYQTCMFAIGPYQRSSIQPTTTGDYLFPSF